MALIISKRGEDPRNGETPSAEVPPKPSGASFAEGTRAETGPSERERKDAELVREYGEARTSLSRHMAGQVASLLDDTIAIGEMMVQGGGFGGGGRRMAVRSALRGIDLELTEPQQEKTAELYQEFQARELEKAREVVQELKKDPSVLMELFLAGDAVARGEMEESQYDAIVSAGADQLGKVINPLDRENFRGGRPMEDETFRSEFEGMLEGEQVGVFQEAMAEREDGTPAAEGGAPETSIANLPRMELEKLDEALTSMGKMTSGFRQAMEGMGTLRNLQPEIEPGSGGPDSGP